MIKKSERHLIYKQEDLRIGTPQREAMEQDIQERLETLTLFSISDCVIDELPIRIKEAKKLMLLYFEGLQLKKLPTWLGYLSNLQELNLRYNHLNHLPNFIKRLKNLKDINLNNNYFTKIPDCLQYLTGLSGISMNTNRIYEIPLWVLEMPHLMLLLLINNPISYASIKIYILSLPSNIKHTLRIEYGVGDNAFSVTNEDLTTNQMPIDQQVLFIQKYGQRDLVIKNKKELAYIEELVTSKVLSLRRLKNLTIQYCGLTKCPLFFWQLRQLEVLDLSHNCLDKIPCEIIKLTKLKNIYLKDNQLTDITILFENINLFELDVSNNKIQRLPSITKAADYSLKCISLSNNQITSIDGFIIKSLNYLVLENNQLTDLPLDLQGLQDLLAVYLENNQFVSIPEVLKEIKTINILKMSNNPLTTIPKWIYYRSNYFSLYVYESLITEEAIIDSFEGEIILRDFEEEEGIVFIQLTNNIIKEKSDIFKHYDNNHNDKSRVQFTTWRKV